ncbi:hypothetical protein AGMMS50218_15290 [Actinomycetota bacterium]|nr:hypothetical protein AGMMS50218_15290 [Actinomycetota bacterium]
MTTRTCDRWTPVGDSSWTLVTAPEGGWWSRLVTRYVRTCTHRRALVMMATAQVVLAAAHAPGLVPRRASAGMFVAAALVWVASLVLVLPGAAPGVLGAAFAGGRLVPAVTIGRCADEERSVVSALVADLAAGQDADLTGLVHELLWEAGRPGSPTRGRWARLARGREADATDQSWRAWSQFARRTMAPLATHTCTKDPR